jgi:hypothetical protein
LAGGIVARLARLHYSGNLAGEALAMTPQAELVKAVVISGYQLRKNQP